MTNFIEELYYGNIDPQNSGFERDVSVQRELRTISENEGWLAWHLTGEEKTHFLDFADAWSAYNGDATLGGFITGFRLGARFVVDIFVLPEALGRGSIDRQRESCRSLVFRLRHDSLKDKHFGV